MYLYHLYDYRLFSLFQSYHPRVLLILAFVTHRPAHLADVFDLLDHLNNRLGYYTSVITPEEFEIEITVCGGGGN